MQKFRHGRKVKLSTSAMSCERKSSPARERERERDSALRSHFSAKRKRRPLRRSLFNYRNPRGTLVLVGQVPVEMPAKRADRAVNFDDLFWTRLADPRHTRLTNLFFLFLFFFSVLCRRAIDLSWHVNDLTPLGDRAPSRSTEGFLFLRRVRVYSRLSL